MFCSIPESSRDQGQLAEPRQEDHLRRQQGEDLQARDPNGRPEAQNRLPQSQRLSRGQCYKTFYDRNLRLFVISWSICRWQTFPA